MKEEDILRAQPFRAIIGKILKVEPLAGLSAQAFRITSSSGRKYKLRYCSNLRQAWKIERNVKKFPKAFPKFYVREGRFLLFEWVEGEIIGKNISVEEAYRIGKMVGEAHALEEIEEGKDIDVIFEENFRLIKRLNIFDEEVLTRFKLKYKNLKEKLKIDVVLEFGDVHGANFMRNSKGRIYFIDEEGFSHRLKGEGMTKAFIIQTWLGNAETREAFMKGYREHHSDDYFDLDYQRLLAFLGMLKSIQVKHRTGRDYSEHKKAILEML